MAKKLLQALVLALVLIGASWGALEWAARRTAERVEARVATLIDGHSPEESYPLRSRNRTVAEVERLGGELGIELGFPDDPEGTRPEATAVAAFEAIHGQLGDFLIEVRRQESADLPPAQPDILSYLAARSGVVAELRSLLLEEEPPVWDLDLSEGFAMPIPRFVSLLSLQRLLLVDALEAQRVGDRERAELSLGASWRLNEATLAQPYLIAQLVGVGVLRDQVGVLLRQRELSTAWFDRLRSLEPRRGVYRALLLEGWVAHATAQREDLAQFATRDLPPPAKTYLRLCLDDYAERMIRVVEGLPGTKLADFDAQRILAEAQGEMPFWNVVARVLMPNLFDAWPRAARTELALDLVARVEELRRQLERDAAAELAGRSESVVEGHFWVVESSPGTVSIRIDPDLPISSEHPLPLRFRVVGDDVTESPSLP